VRRLREARYEVEYDEVTSKKKKEEEAALEHKRQIERRMHPRTAEDFQILYKELDAWRRHETKRIKESGLSAEETHFQLEELLGKEVKLLQTIDRLKISANKINKVATVKETLEKVCIFIIF
jgi:hypothetical protein